MSCFIHECLALLCIVLVAMHAAVRASVANTAKWPSGVHTGELDPTELLFFFELGDAGRGGGLGGLCPTPRRVGDWSTGPKGGGGVVPFSVCSARNIFAPNN